MQAPYIGVVVFCRWICLSQAGLLLLQLATNDVDVLVISKVKLHTPHGFIPGFILDIAAIFTWQGFFFVVIPSGFRLSINSSSWQWISFTEARSVTVLSIRKPLFLCVFC